MKWGAAPPRNRALWGSAWFQALLHGVARISCIFSSLWAERGHCDLPLLWHMPSFRCCRIVPWHGSGPSPKILIPLRVVLRSSPHATDILRGLVWPAMGCVPYVAPALWGWSSSLVTSAAYASSVRSRANSKLALAVSLNNVLTISVPSSLSPPSPWTTKLITVIFFYLNTVVE